MKKKLTYLLISVSTLLFSSCATTDGIIKDYNKYSKKTIKNFNKIYKDSSQWIQE